MSSMGRPSLSETIVRCPKCGEELRVTLTLVPEQLPHAKSTEAQPQLKRKRKSSTLAPGQLPDTRFPESEKQIQVEAVAEPKVELDVEAIDWKRWEKGTGEWVNVLEAKELFEKIQKAGGQLEHGGYRYWIFGKNKDMIGRNKS